jgi:Fic family protein
MERRFIWQQSDWPALRVDAVALAERLDRIAFRQGEVAGALRAIAAVDRDSLEQDAFTQTAVETSAIEGEHISVQSVRNSLVRRLGLGNGSLQATSREADGIVAVTVDALRNSRLPLTRHRLLRWNDDLFPGAPRSITVGAWRTVKDDPMQVVSGPVTARVVHFQAPPAVRVETEMNAFLGWFEQRSTLAPAVHAAVAHLRFLTIHPFSDGNGRIGRAIADLDIARDPKHVAPYVSLSRQIREDRRAYYLEIERAQRATVDVTQWAAWFCDCYGCALSHTLQSIDGLLRANAFWRANSGVEFNARQRKVLERYLAGDFTGWLNSRKYRAITQVSLDSAQRDLSDLAHKRIIFANDGKARKTSYRLSEEFDPNRHAAASTGEPSLD